MKKHILLLLVIAGSLGACKTIQVRDFHTTQILPSRLPQLGLLVHERSFLEAFDCAFTREVVIANALGGPYQPAPWVAYDFTDRALEDAFQVLGNELDENMSQDSDLKYGQARFKMLYYKRRNAGWGWSLASAGTLFIPNLFGMPVKTYRSQLELQMEIVDANGKVLRRYVAPGAGRAQVAAYHGYDGTTAMRKANLLALQNALAEIKKKMEPDVPGLTAQLESAGTLKKQDGK